MRLPELLNKPLVIGGQDVVLVDDHIGDLNIDSSDLLEIEPPRDDSPGFYASEKDILQIRAQYPEHRTYGLWQTLYHSGLLTGAGILFVPNTDMDGRYAQMSDEGGRWVPQLSGIVSGGMLSGLPNESLDQAHHVNITLDLLNLPSHQALLVSEYQAQIQKRTKQRYTAAGLAALAILIVTVVLEVVLMMQHRAATLEMKALQAKEEELLGTMTTLLKSRRPKTEPYEPTLGRIYELLTIDPSMSIKQGSMVEMSAILNRDFLQLVRALPWANPEITPTGQLEVPIVGGGSHK